MHAEVNRVPMVPLEELMATRQGSVDPSKFASETFALYSIPAFDSRRPEVLTGGAIGSTKQVVQPEDVLLSKIVPHIRRSWIVGPKGEHRQIASGEWIVFRNPRVVPEYLRHALLSDDFHAQFMQTVSGVGGSLLRARPAQVAKIQIPLPPLTEQRRIAAILDKADALRTKRREALAQLDRLAQAIFVEMFGDPTAFTQKPLQNLCDLITDGTHQTPTYADEGTIFLSAKNVTSGQIDWVNVKYVPPSLHAELHARLAPRIGDILLAKNGTTGVAAVVDRNEVIDIYVSLALLRPKADVLPAYLLAAINSPLCTRQFSGALKGIGVPNLHLKDIRQTTIPYPPLQAQRQFTARLKALESIRTSTRNAMLATTAMFAAIQQRAFQGEL